MKYFLLEFLVTNDDFFFEQEVFNIPKLNRLSYQGGSLKDESVEIQYFDKYPHKKAVDHLPGSSVFTASSRFKDMCLELEPSHLEVFPVKLICEKQPREVDFFFLNIQQSLDVFDWEQSDYETYEDTSVISTIRNLVLRNGEIGERNIFRVPAMKTEIFVSERFKLMSEERGVLGVGFMELSDYSK